MKKVLYPLALVSVSVLLSCKQTKNTSSEVAMNTVEVTQKKENKEELIDSILVRKHLYTLASDEMEGRKPGTEGMEKATQYIENEYKRIE